MQKQLQPRVTLIHFIAVSFVNLRSSMLGLTYTLVLSFGHNGNTLYTLYPCPAVVLSSSLRSWTCGGGRCSVCTRADYCFAQRKRCLLRGGRGL